VIARLLGLRGRADAAIGALPRVETDFSGANACAIRWRSGSHLEFAAEAHSSARPLWFHFAVRNASGPRLTCTLTNAGACLGPPSGWSTVRPVFSVDGGPWQRARRGKYLARQGGFRFEVPVTGSELRVAYCYPYSYRDLRQTLAPWAARGAVTELCRSEGGRAVPYVRLGNHHSPRRAVWMLGRQHAGETPASFTVEGLLRALGGVPDRLQDTAVHLLPMLDVDGVDDGRFGKDQQPADFNRDWSDRPRLRAVAAAVHAIRRSREQAPVELVLDVHAPHHGDLACFCFAGPENALAEHPAQRQRRFREQLLLAAPERVGLTTADWREQPAPVGSAREYIPLKFQSAVITLEVSYHLARTGVYLEPRDYRDLGATAAMAMLAPVHP
jgi:hypothetical protein